MKCQVSKPCQVAYFHLHWIRSIRYSLTQHATELLVHSLVISRLDCGNGLLYGVPDQLLDKLQRVQNVAVRIVVRASHYDHITSILETLHWLPVRYRITFKALHLLVPSYIADLLQLLQPCRTLRSSSMHISAIMVIVPTASLLLARGTVFVMRYENVTLYTPLKDS